MVVFGARVPSVPVRAGLHSAVRKNAKRPAGLDASSSALGISWLSWYELFPRG
jgi:hypothetical protein